MKLKMFLRIFLVLVILAAIGVVYLNNVYLPTKAKVLIISAIRESAQKEVSLEALKFNIFKGLVLRNLRIYDGPQEIISVKEASCALFIPPIFKKKVIIPFLRIESPMVFLERRSDSTFNLRDFFVRRPPAPPAKPGHGFSFLFYRLDLTNGLIRFRDNTFSQPFTRNIENINLSMNLTLPAGMKFKLKSAVSSNPQMDLRAAGIFKLNERTFHGKVAVFNISPKEFSPYYQESGIEIPEGLINITGDLDYKENTLTADLRTQSRGVVFSKGKISVTLNSDIASDIGYGFKTGSFKISGQAQVTDSKISGLGLVDTISGIKGGLNFNNTGLSSEKLNAVIWGIPVEAKGNLNNFGRPLLNVTIVSSQSMPAIRDILADKFKFNFSGDISGDSSLSLNIRTAPAPEKNLLLNGTLNIINTRLKLEKLGSPFEAISGSVGFTQGRIGWQALGFKYLGVQYQTSGTIAGFKTPQVDLGLFSDNLALETSFSVNNRLVTLSKFAGHYFNSQFSLSGSIDNSQGPVAELNGLLNVDLVGLRQAFKKSQEQLEKIKLQGKVDTQFHLAGNLNNIKSCAVEAKLSSNSLSLYGLRADSFALTYNQANGVGNIPAMDLSLYEGTIRSAASMNLISQNQPYWLTLDIQGVKLEKLKLDTKSKDRDIAGLVQAYAKINGFSSDLSRLSGAGWIKISEGRLWQLDLFKGLGKLLFIQDFSTIVFHEGFCTFSVKDRYISSDDLTLKSQITNLIGSVKLGFDSSIDAQLNVEVLDENVPLAGTFKDITTAIVGKAGRFGVIKISGTLKEPKYKFKTAVAVTDIIKGLKDILLEKY